MKIGIFDSGLGGLIVAKAIHKLMPEYDYVYLGDTKRVPYGNRSQETIFEFTREGVDYLFRQENCGIVIIACNTASARALRKIQKEYLPKNFPTTAGEDSQRKVLGVLIPAAEKAAMFKKVGILATRGTVNSGSFIKEIKKSRRLLSRDPDSRRKVGTSVIFQNPAPMLVPLAEEGENVLAKPFIKKYLKPLLAKKIDSLVLGCTHYPIFKQQLKKQIEEDVGGNIKIISQDEIIPKELKSYLARHAEIEKKLSKKKSVKILVTDKTQTVNELTRQWFGKIKPKLVKL